MGFETILGNEQLKSNLTKSIQKGRISHFYLISGPKGSGKHTMAKLLAAAAICKGEGKKPCCVCSACRKILDNVHPDFITVDDPEKKTVTVGLVREARQDIYIRPNEADYKFYLFPRAQDMGLEGQNALLKVLEEPPGYGVFLLLTDNPEKLLPTVRSRCTELKMQPLSGEIMMKALKKQFPTAGTEALAAAVRRSGGFLGQAETLLSGEAALPPQTQALADALCSGDAYGLLQVLVPMEKYKRDQLTELLQSWQELVAEAITVRNGAQALSPLAGSLAQSRSERQLHAILKALKKCSLYAGSNVSPAAICGYLSWALRADTV